MGAVNDDDLRYTVTARDSSGRPANVTIGPVDERGSIYYAEYWTGPSPWWKRAWRRLRGHGWRSSVPDREGAWIWPKDCYQPRRGTQIGFRPVEYGIWFPARRMPRWRRWRQR